MEVGSSSVSQTYRVSKNTRGILRWHTTDNLRWQGCTFECHLDKEQEPLSAGPHAGPSVSQDCVHTPGSDPEPALQGARPCLAWRLQGVRRQEPPPQSVPVFLELSEPRRDGESVRSSMHGFSNAKVTVGISAWWQSERARAPALFVAQQHSFGISLAFGEAALWGGASISRWCGEGCSRHMDSFASCLQLPLWGRMEEFPDLVAILAS